MVCDMPEPCKFTSIDSKFTSLYSCQKKLLSLLTHKEVDFAPHPVVGLAHQVGDAEKFPLAMLKELD